MSDENECPSGLVSPSAALSSAFGSLALKVITSPKAGSQLFNFRKSLALLSSNGQQLRGQLATYNDADSKESLSPVESGKRRKSTSIPRLSAPSVDDSDDDLQSPLSRSQSYVVLHGPYFPPSPPDSPQSTRPEMPRPSPGRFSIGPPGTVSRSVSSPALFTSDHSWLPYLPKSAADPIKCISAETLSGLMQGEFHEQIDEHVLVDCRFRYEFDGGHIESAIHRPWKTSIESLYQDCREFYEQNPTRRRIALIFHCEFSSKRAPRASSFFRELDRKDNTYPELNFPQLYILEGGYKNFHAQQEGRLCSGNGYVKMYSILHDGERARNMRKERASWEQKGMRSKSSSARLSARPTLLTSARSLGLCDDPGSDVESPDVAKTRKTKRG